VWGEGKGWTLDRDEVLEIGSDESDSTYHLMWVSDVERLDDGRLFVGNRGTDQLLLFDEEGRFVRAGGGPGEGPGEFSRVGEIFRCAGDTLVVEDTRRVHLFDGSGRFVRTENVVPDLQSRSIGVYGVKPDCSALLLQEMESVPDPPARAYRIPFTLFWARFAGGARDTVAAFPGWEMTRSSRTPLPFGAYPVWTAGGSDVYLARSEAFEVHVFRPGDRISDRVIRWRSPPRAVTAADRAAYAEFRARVLEDEPFMRDVLEPLDDFPAPEHRPAFLDLIVDDEGNLWAREYPVEIGGYPTNDQVDPSDPPDVWHVFDPEGRLLGPVEMPRGFELHGVHGGYAIGVAVDDLDVERVQLYPIDRDR